MLTETLTGVLVLITGLYAWFTFRILRANEAAVNAMREQNESLSRPYVHATLSLLADAPIYVLTIKNHGKTAAENLRVGIDRDFFPFRSEKNLRDLHVFREPVKSFPPGAEFNFWLGTGPDVHSGADDAEDSIEGFMVSIAYDYADSSVEETTIIDFKPFLLTDLPRHDVAHELKKIANSLEKMSKAQR